MGELVQVEVGDGTGEIPAGVAVIRLEPAADERDQHRRSRRSCARPRRR